MTMRRLPVAAPVVLGVAALVLVAALSCGKGGGDPAPTPSPVPSPSPAGDLTATPVPPPEPTDFRFMYSEFGPTEDIVWMIDPANPQDRVEVTRVPHEEGWAIVPAVSPDGQTLAYNTMRPDGVNRAYDGQTYILDLDSGESELVADFVDLQTAPRWDPDGQLLYLRKNVGLDVTIIVVDLRPPDEDDEEPPPEDAPPPVRTILKQDVSDVLAYIPLGFDEEKALLYFVAIQGGTTSGTYLGRYTPATGEAVATATAVAEATATAVAATAEAATPTPTPVGTPTPAPSPTPAPTPVLTGDVFLVLSDQIARDFALSPDAARVAFSVPGIVDGQFVTQTYVTDIATQEVKPLEQPANLPPGDQLVPVWRPEGDRITVGGLPAGDDPGRVAVVPLDGGDATLLAPPDQGFDQPLSWAPDGRFLAVTSFDGDSLGNPGRAALVFVAATGQRLPAPEGNEFQPIGWIAPAAAAEEEAEE
ncbi:MAG: hypothetical protein WD379_02340 [Dehalococcoidia bacterium]